MDVDKISEDQQTSGSALLFGRMIPTDKVLYLAVALALLTLSFTKGLTLNIGFPLKLYEIILLPAIFYWFVRGGRPWERPGLWGPLVGFLSVAIISLVINLWGQPWAGRGGWVFSSRFGPWGDGLAKWVYALFIMSSFFLISSVARKNWRRLTDWWLYGAVLGATISLHFAVSSWFGGALLPIPGLERHQTALMLGRRIIRSGCFQEGNFAALFFILSIALSLQRGKVIPALFFSLACLSTVSSLGLMGCSIVWVGAVLSTSRSTRARVMAGATAFFLSIGALQFGSGYLSEVLFKKVLNDKVISFPRSNQEVSAKDSGSLGVRYALLKEGVRLWKKRPILGIGLSQFGYKCLWNSQGQGLENLVEKPIPNNTYLEILSETGVLGLLMSLLFGVGVCLRGWRSVGWSPLSFGLLALIVGLNIYPSFTVLFIWAFLALWVEAPDSGILK